MGVKFETLKRLQYLSRPGDWALSMDIEDGFHCCSVHQEDRKFMTFNFQGTLIRHAVLPFGWTGSPHVFVKIMSVLTRLLRSPDVPARLGDISPAVWLELRDKILGRSELKYTSLRTLPFCDDYLQLFRTRADAILGREQIQRTLDFLGLAASPTKCIWEPTQPLVHLGLEI